MTRHELRSGVTLNVEVAGSGAPLVLLHGFTGSARGWGEFGAALAAGYTTVAVDIVGHGSSDSPESVEHYRMDQCIDDLADLLRELGHDRAHWLGYSMGGRTALQIAAAHPGRVRTLMVIGGSPGIDCVEDRIARRSADELLARRIENEGIVPFVDYWQSIPLFASQASLAPEVRERIRTGRLRNSPRGLANSLRGMGAGAQEPLQGRLAKMAMPALLLAGELDEKYVAIGREMAVAMPDAEFNVVPGAGHAAHIERPEATAALVRAFLTTRDPDKDGEPL